MVLLKTLGMPAAHDQAAQDRPIGPGFPSFVVDRLTVLEVWGAWEEPGDFVEYRAYAESGLLAVTRVPYPEPSLAAVRQGAHRP